jgi:CubicO group peptidase (beta-lactamase class C family)
MRRIPFVTLVVILLASLVPVASAQESETYWPTGDWRTSTPEEQGIDSQKLADMLALVARRDYNIHSISIIRHGYLVLDVYQPPANPDARHIIHSCTKSVTSILIGIAIDQGYIKSVEQPVLGFFPDRTFQNMDARKESITLEDVLMMASGLDCRDSYLYRWQGLEELIASPDWVQHFLDLPMAHEPGTTFEYCNSGTYLLSKILEAATGMDTLDFAEQYLFEPLGITDWVWRTNPVGGALAWGGLELRPHDMAKIGYLYLHDGMWDGQQIVAPEWVTASTQESIHAGTLAPGYGYQWWVESDDPFIYGANGYAGQFIFVVPEQDMVVVFTSGLSESDFHVPKSLLRYNIVPAAESDTPLPANPDAVAALEAQIEILAHPEPQPVPPLPEIARSISGQSYALDENSIGIESMAMQFEDGADEARFAVVFGDGSPADMAVGLDGVFRVTTLNDQPVALRGTWRKDDVFVLEIRDLARPMNATLRLTFREGGRVECLFQDRVSGEAEGFEGVTE